MTRGTPARAPHRAPAVPSGPGASRRQRSAPGAPRPPRPIPGRARSLLEHGCGAAGAPGRRAGPAGLIGAGRSWASPRGTRLAVRGRRPHSTRRRTKGRSRGGRRGVSAPRPAGPPRASRRRPSPAGRGASARAGAARRGLAAVRPRRGRPGRERRARRPRAAGQPEAPREGDAGAEKRGRETLGRRGRESETEARRGAGTPEVQREGERKGERELSGGRGKEQIPETMEQGAATAAALARAAALAPGTRKEVPSPACPGPGPPARVPRPPRAEPERGRSWARSQILGSRGAGAARAGRKGEGLRAAALSPALSLNPDVSPRTCPGPGLWRPSLSQSLLARPS